MKFGFEKVNKWGDRSPVVEIDLDELPNQFESLLPKHEEELAEIHVFQIT